MRGRIGASGASPEHLLPTRDSETVEEHLLPTQDSETIENLNNGENSSKTQNKDSNQLPATPLRQSTNKYRAVSTPTHGWLT